MKKSRRHLIEFIDFFEDFQWPGRFWTGQPARRTLIFLDFSWFWPKPGRAVGRRPAGLLVRPIPSIFDGNPARNFRRDQQSAQNHLKIMHTSAKHYFEVVWTHMGACLAVGSRFFVIFGAFSRFWTPRPAPLAPSRPSRPQAVPGRGFGRFYKKMEKPQRVL